MCVSNDDDGDDGSGGGAFSFLTDGPWRCMLDRQTVRLTCLAGGELEPVEQKLI